MTILELLRTVNSTDIVPYAIPVFVIAIIGELVVFNAEQREHYSKIDAVSSIAMGLGSILFNLACKMFYFVIFSYIYTHYSLFQFGYVWWAWILVLFADDFSFYWHHRCSHQVHLLWAAHSVHHSSQHYNLSTALRQSWTEWMHKYLFFIWMPFVGFHPAMILTMMSINLIYQYFLHTEVVRKYPAFIEFFFNTPSHHRAHHGTNIQYLDKNHAGIFIIWDRMFGTFEPEVEKVVYGLTVNIETHNPVRIATAGYEGLWGIIKKPMSWGNRLRYLFLAPGWSHDGSMKTTKELVAERNAMLAAEKEREIQNNRGVENI